MMLPVRWTGRERGAALSNDRCVLTFIVISGHRILELGVSASRPARRYGPRTRTGYRSRPVKARRTARFLAQIDAKHSNLPGGRGGVSYVVPRSEDIDLK
jgi:hypothetical protein